MPPRLTAEKMRAEARQVRADWPDPDLVHMAAISHIEVYRKALTAIARGNDASDEIASAALSVVPRRKRSVA